MSAVEAISQRDLRLRSKQIMDAVEDGHSFTVTRGGHSIGELIPLRRPRIFVPREQFQSARAGLSPLYTTNPDGFAGLDSYLKVMPVSRPTF